jgi:hypothetical protein
MDLRPFEQLPSIAHGFEMPLRNEAVMKSIHFAGALGAGGHGDRRREIEVLSLQEHARESRFASPRWRRKDEHQTSSGGLIGDMRERTILRHGSAFVSVSKILFEGHI